MSGKILRWKRWLVGTGILLTALFLVVVMLLGYGLHRARERTSQDPATVEKAARLVMQFQIPGGAQGVVRYPVHAVDVFVLQNASTPPEGTLILAHFPAFAGSASADAKIRRKIEARMSQRMIVAREQTIIRSICQRDTQVRIRHGRTRTHHRGLAPNTAVTSYDALILHKGRLRMAMAVGSGKSADKVAGAIFDSLSCPQ